MVGEQHVNDWIEALDMDRVRPRAQHQVHAVSPRVFAATADARSGPVGKIAVRLRSHLCHGRRCRL
jgi:hypothetical protein